MSILENILKYIFINYPNVRQLSKPRLVKIIYLIDWKHTLDYGYPATNIKWIFNHHGPYVEDVINLVLTRTSMFKVSSYQSSYGTGHKIYYIGDNTVALDKNIIKIIDFVIQKTAELGWNEFIQLVYDTYPIKKFARYSILDLVASAEEYRALNERSIINSETSGNLNHH